MKTLAKALARKQDLKDKRQNTPVVAPCGKYSYDSSLVIRGGELERIAEESISILGDYGRLLGFGEQYDKICSLVERFNTFQEKALKMQSTGGDWEN